jgi:hypothetical protein
LIKEDPILKMGEQIPSDAVPVEVKKCPDEGIGPKPGKSCTQGKEEERAAGRLTSRCGAKGRPPLTGKAWVMWPAGSTNWCKAI